MPEYDVFISYRRDGGDALSRLLYNELTRDGYRVFYDVETMHSGKFNEQILQSIAASKTVIIVLPPHGLDRCSDPEDWVRRELEYAISKGKTLIPVMMRGFVWEEDKLPDSLKELQHYQGIAATDNSLFNSWYAKLKTYIDEQIGYSPTPASTTQPAQSEIADQDYEWGLIALEDGDFEKAKTIFSQILQKNVRNGRAWIGLMLARNQMSREEELAKAARSLEKDKDFQRALRYADPELKARLQKYANTVGIRIAEARRIKAREFTAKGNIVTFGRFPQTENGIDKTPVKWIVLDVQENKSLLISEFGLDMKPYNTELIDAPWETCSLRTWLNNDFVETAFSEEERNAVLITEVDNSQTQGCSQMEPINENNTQDKVFLLSYTETWSYFPTRYDRQCRITKYVEAQMKKYLDTDFNFLSWWLRTHSFRLDVVLHVTDDGDISSKFVNELAKAVRPAIWLDLNRLPV